MSLVVPILRIRNDFEDRHRLELFVKDPRLSAVFNDGEASWDIPTGHGLLWNVTLGTFFQILYREKDLL